MLRHFPAVVAGCWSFWHTVVGPHFTYTSALIQYLIPIHRGDSVHLDILTWMTERASSQVFMT